VKRREKEEINEGRTKGREEEERMKERNGERMSKRKRREERKRPFNRLPIFNESLPKMIRCDKQSLLSITFFLHQKERREESEGD